MTLGEKLQNLRSEAEISQEELAERLGVSRQAVSKWELDKTVPEVKYIVALSELFGVSTDFLLKEQPQDAPPVSAAAPYEKAVPEPWTASDRKDHSPLVCALLLIGDGLLLMLNLLHFPLMLVVSHRLTFIPVFLALLFGPVFLLASRVFLRSPAKSLRLYRHAAAACLTAWGFAIALLLGYGEVVGDLLFAMVEGRLSIPMLLVLTNALLVVLYIPSFFLARLFTRSVTTQ